MSVVVLTIVANAKYREVHRTFGNHPNGPWNNVFETSSFTQSMTISQNMSHSCGMGTSVQ